MAHRTVARQSLLRLRARRLAGMARVHTPIGQSDYLLKGRNQRAKRLVATSMKREMYQQHPRLTAERATTLRGAPLDHGRTKWPLAALRTVSPFAP
jgi:hypothetical protein